MRSSSDSMNAVCDRRNLLKLASGALLGNAAARLGVIASVAATTVLVEALPAYAQAEKKEIKKKRSSERLNGKTMFEWMSDLKEKDLSVRERAIASLKFYEEEAREAAPAVIKAISDNDMSLRVNAIITLGFIGMDPKDRQVGIDALKRRLMPPPDSQGIVRFQAARALGRLEKDGYDAVPALIYTTRDKFCWEIRAAAVTALGYAGWDPTGGGFDPGAFKTCVESTRDECLEVRVQALLSLIRFGMPALALKRNLESALHALISDKRQHKRVVLWARVALMRIQPPGTPQTTKFIDKELVHVGEILKDRELETRVNAARAIAFMGESAKSVVPQLVDALEDHDSEMIVWTCFALGSMKNAAAGAGPALKRLERHPDPAVQSAAKAALEKIGERDVK